MWRIGKLEAFGKKLVWPVEMLRRLILNSNDDEEDDEFRGGCA